ncbi:hypothetical protein [Microbacterium sp. NPDC056569]|uniref:hypothetical protein n=1 Tax=Microbacterium sp. NPDC056569 TaxID=3345867 RepID=UPI00366BA7BE
MNRKKKLSVREMQRRGRKEYLTASAVVASVIIGLIGAAIVVLGAYLFISNVVYLVGGGNPFVMVGIARPTPVWLATIAAVAGIVGGWWLLSMCVGYLYRCATGQVIKLSREELKKHREHLAERERQMRAGR